MTKTVAVITGSLRAGSINRKLARTLESMAEGRLAFTHVEIGDLPLYNEDVADPVPAPVARLRQQIRDADAVLVLTPEYNRTYPGVLANAFDWGSRPYGQSAWAGKPVAIAGATGGATGTAAAQQHLRLAVVNLGMLLMAAPELYITWTSERFAEDGSVQSADTRKLLQGYVDAFAAFIERHA